MDRAVTPVNRKGSGIPSGIQIGVKRKAIDGQRSIDGRIGINAVVVAEHHVQVNWKVLPTSRVVNAGEHGRRPAAPIMVSLGKPSIASFLVTSTQIQHEFKSAINWRQQQDFALIIGNSGLGR